MGCITDPCKSMDCRIPAIPGQALGISETSVNVESVQMERSFLYDRGVEQQYNCGMQESNTPMR